MIYKNIYGEDHPDVVLTYSDLAVVYENLGEDNLAIELRVKARMICEKNIED